MTIDIPTPEKTELARGRLHIMRASLVAGVEDLPPGRFGNVTAEDLEATRHRIRTGLPMAPFPGVWRW